MNKDFFLFFFIRNVHRAEMDAGDISVTDVGSFCQVNIALTWISWGGGVGEGNFGHPMLLTIS